MDTRETVALRIRQLCAERKITPNGLANLSAVPQATIKSILNDESKNPGVVTIKKLCDGLDITLGEFFSTLYTGYSLFFAENLSSAAAFDGYTLPPRLFSFEWSAAT